jgi:hypothetical protein
MLEDCRFESCNGKFVEFAVQGPQCALEHVKYLQDKGCELFWLNSLKKVEQTGIYRVDDDGQGAHHFCVAFLGDFNCRAIQIPAGWSWRLHLCLV